MSRILLSVFGLLSLVCIAFAAAAWNVNDELKGAWSVQKSVFDPASDAEPQLSTLTVNMTEGLHADILTGSVLDTLTGGKLKIHIQRDAETKGSFQLLKAASDEAEGEDLEFDESDDSDEGKNVQLDFPFNFAPSDIGYYTATAAYTGAEEGVVDFVVLNKNSWILTKVSKSGRVERWIAKRTDIPQPGFLSKYGPMMLMVGFFLLSNVFKQRMAQPGAPAAGAAKGKAD